MSHIKNIGILSGSFIYMEIILRIFTREKFINIGVFYSIIFAVAVSIFLYILLSFFDSKKSKILTGVFLGFISFVFASQLVYYEIFNTFYTVYSAGKAVHAFEFFGDMLYEAMNDILWIVLLYIPLMSFLFMIKKKKLVLSKFSWVHRTLSFVILFVIIGAMGISIKIEMNSEGSSYGNFLVNSHPVVMVNNFGLLTTMGLDLQRTVLGIDSEIEPPVLNAEEIEKAHELDTVVYDEDAKIGETKNEDPEFNIININFDELNDKTTDEILINMNEYFNLVKPTNKNKYTGMFEGYNLIMITAESFYGYAVSEEVTPTLYKMLNEGFNFTNFYNPLWGVSTSDGEYVANMSLIPKSGVWSMYLSGENHVPYAMGNMLKKFGYKTMAFHNHTYTYYERHISHPNMGYEYKGLGNGLEVAPTWPESDVEMMELSVDDYINSEPFHAYYMTVSGHMRYNFFGNYIASKNKELVEGLSYSENVKAYLATQIELDKSLEYLIKRLEEEGVAENTLIVLSPDHYPYALDKEELDELAGFEMDYNFDIYKSGLIIYAKGMEPEVVEKPLSSLDILPTVMNLMGLEYDSRLLMGKDVFSDLPSLVIFFNKSFITDKGKYNSIEGEFYPFEGEFIEDNYVQGVIDEIDRKFYYSMKILDMDYYRFVFEQ